jgi:hypothetical protein
MDTTILWITGLVEALIVGYGMGKYLTEMKYDEFDEGRDYNDSITQQEFYKDGQE